MRLPNIILLGFFCLLCFFSGYAFSAVSEPPVNEKTANETVINKKVVNEAVNHYEIVPLKISINTSDQGEFFVIFYGDDVLISEVDYAILNINLFEYIKITVDGEAFLSLTSLSPDLTFLFNDTSLVLQLDVNPLYLSKTKLDLVKKPMLRRNVSGIDSAFLNYALISRGNTEQGFQTLEIPLEGVISAHDWLLQSTFTYHYSELNKQFIEAYWVRGLTNLTKDNPKKLSRFVIGDFSANSNELGGSGVFLGLNFQKKYSMATYFSKYPGLTVNGILHTPSKINMYLNDVLIRSEQLPAGEYEVANLPNLYGAGSLKVEIIDAFGRRRVRDVPYYISTRLLRVGLDDYSYSFGLQRDSLNVVQPTYNTTPAFLGYHRWGIKKYLTAGYRFEISETVTNAGVNGNILVGSFGEAEAGFSISQLASPTAYAGFFRYGFTSQYFHGRYSFKQIKKDYQTLSTADQSNIGRASTIQSIGLGIHGLKIGSLAINYSQLNTSQINISQSNSVNKVDIDTWSLVYSLRVAKRTSVLFRGVRTIDNSGSSDAVFASINSTFGKRTSMSAAHVNQQSSVVNSAYLQRSTPIGTGVGYRLRVSQQMPQALLPEATQATTQATTQTTTQTVSEPIQLQSLPQENIAQEQGGKSIAGGGVRPIIFQTVASKYNESLTDIEKPSRKSDVDSSVDTIKTYDYLADASVQIKMKYISISADFFQGKIADSYQSNLAGSMVFIDNDYFLSRPIYDSFALVKVSDLDDVSVYFGNEIVDKTENGKLIVPNLTSYANNRLAIEAFDIPIDRSLKQTQKIVSPKYRAGSVSSFEVDRFQGFSGFLFLRKNGQERTADFSELTLMKSNSFNEAVMKMTTVVGRHGEFYFENLKAGRYNGRVKLAGEVCEFNMTISSSNQMMVELGKHVCQL